MATEQDSSADKVFTDTPPQAINRIDHIGFIVRYENFQKYVDFVSKLLDITFDEPSEYVAGNVIYSVAWAAGLEFIAPIREEGPYWDRLQRFGEGCPTVIFGVEDMEAALARAKEMGVEIAAEVHHPVRPAWMDRFKSFREVRTHAFPADFCSALTFGEIIPK